MKPIWLDDFERRHGNDCIRVKGRILYSDGAERGELIGGFCDLHEPPDNPYELAQRKYNYCEAELRQAMNSYEDLREQLRSNAIAGVRDGLSAAPAETAFEQLEGLREEVKQRRERLAAAKAEVEATRPPRIDNLARTRAANQAVLERLEAMKL